MAAYLIVNLKVHDPVAYEAYRQHVPAIIAAHGGRYLIRGGAMEVLEGDIEPSRQVVIEFPDMGAARAFYADPVYQPLLKIRQSAATGTMTLVEGV